MSPLNEIDYLLYSPGDCAGALGFGLNVEPPAPKRRFNQTLDLAKLQDVADAIIKDEEFPADSANDQIEDLMLIGTSMGGARPKAVVENESGLWIINSKGQMINGIMRALNMPCLFWHEVVA